MELFKYLYNLVKGSLFGKIVLVLVISLVASLLIFCSCTSHRSVSLSVNKADSVGFYYSDSTRFNQPLFYVP